MIMEKKKSIFQRILEYLKGNPIVVILTVVSLVVGLTVKNFFSFYNLNNLASNTGVRFIIALGISGCLIIKGTDLSAGRIVGIASCITAVLVQRADYASKMYPQIPEMNMWLVLVIVLIVGTLIGLINGLIIALLNVPPFIATLGTQTIVYGCALIFTNSQPVGGYQKVFSETLSAKLFPIGPYPGIPVYVLFAIFFGLIFAFLYKKTTYGKYMYAIGGNEVAAEVSGVNTKKSKILIFTLAGFMYAFAGYLLAAKSGEANAGLGQGYELEAIAGCTIGGVSTTGGIGTISGILIGVLVFELLKIVLQFLGVNPYFNFIVQGLVIVTAVAIDIRKYVARK